MKVVNPKLVTKYRLHLCLWQRETSFSPKELFDLSTLVKHGWPCTAAAAAAAASEQVARHCR